jgi:hypothetical protein
MRYIGAIFLGGWVLASAVSAQAQSCGELGGDYCSQGGACPAGYTSLGQSYTTESQWIDEWCETCQRVCDSCQDCWTNCDEDGNCWDECTEVECNCRDECSQRICGGHWAYEQVNECNPCCVSQPPDPGPS